MQRPTPRRRRVLASVAVVAAAAPLALAGLAPGGAAASSHREAPQISGLPQYDNTDTYAFVSPDRPDTVTLVANWIPLQEPAGGPTFYPFATDARYDLNVDNNGDAKPDQIYRYSFTSSYQNKNTFLYNTGPVDSLNDPDLNFRQTYKLELIEPQKGRTTTLANNVPVAPSFVGNASMPNYQTLRDQATVGVKDGIKTFAGQADDPFFVDLRVFNLLFGGKLDEVGNDTVAGYNVNTVALQIPKSKLLRGGDPVIGVWSTTQRQNAYGNWVQISRLGMPLVNEVVIPVKQKDWFNGSKPRDDAQFLKFVTDPEVPKLVEAIYKIKAPATPRNDLIQVFLTGVPKLNQPKNVKPSEQIRLNTSIAPSATPKRLGVLDGDNAGFPNGRRLSDDAVDITLQAAEGELVGSPNDIGDGVDANDQAFGKSFPYVALPNSGSNVRPKATGSMAGVDVTEGGKGMGTPEPTTVNSEPVSADQKASSDDMAKGLGISAIGVAALLGTFGAWFVMRRRRQPALTPGQYTGTGLDQNHQHPHPHQHRRHGR